MIAAAAMKHASSSEVLATCSTSRRNVVDCDGRHDCIAWWCISLQHEMVYRCVVVDQSIRVSHKHILDVARGNRMLRAVIIG